MSLKENEMLVNYAPVIGMGTSLVLLMSMMNLLKMKKSKEEKIEDNGKIFFKPRENEYSKQREQLRYFNSINSQKQAEPIPQILNNIFQSDCKSDLSDLLATLFSPPLEKIQNPTNFIEIPADKTGPFKYSYYPSTNKYTSKLKGLCLLAHDIDLNTTHLDKFYPEVKISSFFFLLVYSFQD